MTTKTLTSLFDSGCVGTSRVADVAYGPGRSTQIDVVVSPNCESGSMTSWKFTVGCPAAPVVYGQHVDLSTQNNH